MTDLEQYIKGSVSLTLQEVKRIGEYFRKVELKKGDFFIRAGRYCDKLSFVQTGFIRIFVEANDREVTQWISPPGYFITELSSFITRTEARWNMQALSDCTLLEINRQEYEALGREVPVWKDVDRLFIVKCFTALEDRIFNHLHMSTEERFQHMMKTQPELFNVVPLQYLASMLGMTPETLSRLRKKQLP